MPFVLIVMEGPDLAGHKITLQKPKTSFGRVNPPCDVLLDSPKVSRHHCDFELKNGRLFVTDKDSDNGVYRNGAKTSYAELEHRDRLAIGEFVFEVVVV